MSAYNWNDRYTTEQMELIIDNLLDIVAEKFIEDYNDGFINKEDIIESFSNFGFKKTDINDFFGWIDED